MKLLREPLVHFLIIGAAIFGLYAATDDAPAPDDRERIIVTAADIERLAGLWQKRWQRPPSAMELRGLIDGYVRQEILYREAIALGLDRDDTVIRSRLAQKFEFLTEDLAAAREPTEAELAAFLDANRDRYRLPPRLSFTQVYFSPDRRGDSVETDAAFVLAALRADGAAGDPGQLGDRVMLNMRYRRQTPQDIAAVFGQVFADAIAGLERGAWSGPVASGYGLHLVRIDERTPADMPPLSEIAQQVRDDWAYEQRRRANAAVYERLLARYAVVIEDAPVGTAALATPGVVQERQP